MFAFLMCVWALQQVHPACVVKDMCPDNTTIRAEIVGVHNAFRRAVQPTASDMLLMSYSEEVAVSAQAWVDQGLLAHGPPSSRMLNGYELGQNLFYSSAPHSWTEVIGAWQAEVAHYLYPKGSKDGQEIGHDTQVIWSSSYRVGCGVALNPNKVYIYGCNYYRAGNFRGYPPYKAGPPCASCPNSCEDKLCTNPCPYINKYSNCPTLKKTIGCSNHQVSAWCPAACQCAGNIIPIA